jgi:hypothetical protein
MKGNLCPFQPKGLCIADEVNIVPFEKLTAQF